MSPGEPPARNLGATARRFAWSSIRKNEKRASNAKDAEIPRRSRSTQRFHLSGQHIPCAAFGANDLGGRWLQFERLAQAADLNVDRAIVDLVIVQARQIEQLFP